MVKEFDLAGTEEFDGTAGVVVFWARTGRVVATVSMSVLMIRIMKFNMPVRSNGQESERDDQRRQECHEARE